MPLLEPNAVIVLDNASYHSVRSERIPNTSTRKQEILDWLRSKNIPAEATMVRAELLELVKMNKPQHIRYVIDELAEASGRVVLRTPPYHCELNPIELVWAQMM